MLYTDGMERFAEGLPDARPPSMLEVAPADPEIAALQLVPDVPDFEVIEQQHKQVVGQYGIVLGEGQSLQGVLTTFEPRVELIIRGRYGLYPFDRPQTDAELGERLGIQPASVRKAYNIAYETLQSGEYSKRKGVSGDISLEVLGYVAAKRLKGADSNDILFLMKLRGLTPFARPVATPEMATECSVSTNTIRVRAQRIAGYLLRRAQDSQAGKDDFIEYESFKSYRNEAAQAQREERTRLLQRHLKARDAGIYAIMLCAFAEPQTRKAWRRVFRQDLVRAKELREQQRARFATQPHPLRKVIPSLLKGSEELPDFSILHGKRAYNWYLDRVRGHDRVLAELVMRARCLTPDDIPDLQQVIREGKEAERQIVEDNVALIFFTAGRLAGRRGLKSLPADTYAAGYQGLHETARRYDADTGFTFATYGIRMIAGHILNQFAREDAERLGVSVRTLREMRCIEEVEQDILQGYHGELPPDSDSLVAEKLGWPMTRITACRRRWAERRDTVLSLNQPHTTDDNRQELIDALAAPHSNYEQDTSSELQKAFDAVFDVLGLDSIDKDIVFRLYGVKYEQLTPEEVAEHFNISVKEVKGRFRRARFVIHHSQEAGKILMKFVQPTS